MKIAIYGDSYADYNYRPYNKKTWMHYLEDKLNNNIFNFANSGSGLYFSIKRYLETHHEFDKIIFIVTFPGRLFIPQNKTGKYHFGGISTAQVILDSTNDFSEKKICSSVIDYFLYVQNYEEELFKHYSMLGRIKENSNLLLIPVAPDSIENYLGTTLTDVCHIDYDHYNIPRNAPRKDLRCCHMNQQNNKIFADLIYDWIMDKEFVFDINKFVPPTESENEMFDSTLYI